MDGGNPIATPQAPTRGGHGKSLRGIEAGARRTSDFGRFGRMFPGLDPLVVDDDRLRSLADTMLDDNSGPDNLNVPSGYTYLGQFIDHDVTLDTTTAGQNENDLDALVDFRTPLLDLDNLYGNGPGAQPSLYDRLDSRKLGIGRTQPGGGGDPGIKGGLQHDLMRTREGLAVIGDPRNDENLVVAQTHLAFVHFHNAVVDRIDQQGGGGSADQVFAAARQTVTWHYQWLVLHDFLDRLIDNNDIADVLANGRKLFRFETLGKYGQPFIPIEFSAAGYRLGHSMVRERYSYNRPFSDIDFNLLFQFTGKSGGILGDLRDQAGIGARLGIPIPPLTLSTLPSDWIIDWNRFFELDDHDQPTPAGSQPKPAPPGGPAPAPTVFKRNFSRPIDPMVASMLHTLPGGGSLPFLNLMRGVRLGLPSGQAVAAEMNRLGVPVPTLTPDQIGSGPDGARAAELGLTAQTPLWYYILKEAQVEAGGQRLGSVGSRILAETFIGLLQADGASFLNQPGWQPTLGTTPGVFKMPDLLRFTGVIDPVNDPTNF